MRKRVTDLNSLRLAKTELKADLELSKTKIELEYTKIKDHYIPANIDTSGGLITLLPSLVKPVIRKLLINKILKSKGRFTSAIVRILLNTFFK